MRLFLFALWILLQFETTPTELLVMIEGNDDIQTDITQTLESLPMTVQWVENAQNIQSPLLIITITDGGVQFFPQNTPQTAQSPILMNGSHLDVYPLEDIQAITTTYAYYTYGQCDPFAENVLTVNAEHLLRGNCALFENDIEQAMTSYQQGIDDRYYPAYINMAWIHTQQGDGEIAMQLLQQFSDVDLLNLTAHQQIEWLSHRAMIEAAIFQYTEAIETISQAIEIATENNLSDDILAILYKQRGDHIFLIYEWDRVLNDYDRAIEYNPAYADAYFARGVLYYTQGPRTQALTDFEQFIALVKTNDTRYPYAQFYIESIMVELEALNGDDMGAFGPSD